MKKPLALSLAVAVFVSGAVIGWLRFLAADPLHHALPDLDDRVATVVSAGDPAAVAACAAELGSFASVRAYEMLRDGAVGQQRTLLLPHLATWGEGVATAFGLDEYRTDAEYWNGADAGRAADLLARVADVRGILADGALPPDSVKTRLLDHAGALRDADLRLATAQTGYALANICLKLGAIADARAGFAAVLADARRWGLTAETCDALNSLALFALVDEDPAAAAMLDESLTLARRSRLAARAGRALTVAGIHARREGRFARSMDLLEDAVTVCGDLGESWQGLPYLIYLMRFHAGLDDWRQVSLLVPRADLLAREATAAGADPLMLQRELARLGELRLRLEIHTGRIEQALAGYPGLVAEARRLPFAEASYIQDRQVRALLAAGRPDVALQVLPDAVAYAEDQDQPELLNLLLAEAEADLDLGRSDAATAALDRFDAAAARRAGWVGDLRLDALALRFMATPSDAAPLQEALGLLAERVGASDASSLAYLEIQRNRLLRDALRALGRDDPETAFGMELLWRRLPAWLGDPGLPAAFATDPAGLARELCRARRARLETGDVQVLYVIAGRRVTRWQVSRATVDRDDLEIPVDDLHERVNGLLAMLGTDPCERSDSVPDELERLAESLAADLLPVRFRTPASDPSGTLLVGSEGFLAQLPFGVLDVVRGPGYHPLALDRNVVGLRDAGPRSAGTAAAGLLVADPEVAPRLRRRHPGLTDLAAAAGEIDRIRAVAPGVEVMSGTDATLAGVTGRWQDAGLLYFACHTVRSPESPFRTFLPLGSDSGAGTAMQTPYLDIAAIRGADFSRCGMVVLASCASGAPYVSGRGWAPSLGDAFLDAGAAAVLQTRWRVRDEDAAGLPATALELRLRGGLDPIAAVTEARRRVMLAPDGGVRHPFGWAAYELVLREP